MTKTFKELLEHRADLQQTFAVYAQIITDLERFLPDLDDNVRETITVEGLGPVPKDYIEAVIKTIKTEHCDPIKEEIKALENLEIPDEEIDQQESTDEEQHAEEGSSGKGSGEEGTGARSGKAGRPANADRAGNQRGQQNPQRVSLRNHK